MNSNPSYKQPYTQFTDSMEYQTETSTSQMQYQYPPQNQGQPIMDLQPQANLEMQQIYQQNQQPFYMQQQQQMHQMQQMQQVQSQGHLIQYPSQPVQYPGQPIQHAGQPMANQQGSQFVTIQIKNSIQKLTEAQGIYIKQKFETFEVLTGIETPNVYRVFPADSNGKQLSNQTMFKCKENSEFCTRQCLPGSMRPFNMSVRSDDAALDYVQQNQQQFLSLERPYQCTFFNYNRPEMEVIMIDNGQRLLQGKIVQPFLCCTLGVNILDEFNNIKYIIEGSCCQLGNICKGMPFKECQEYSFDVKTPDGQFVTLLQKKSAGFLKAMVGDADNFSLVFPPGTTVQDKTLLMSAALFIDYMYFENKHGNKGINQKDGLLSSVFQNSRF